MQPPSAPSLLLLLSLQPLSLPSVPRRPWTRTRTRTQEDPEHCPDDDTPGRASYDSNLPAPNLTMFMMWTLSLGPRYV